MAFENEDSGVARIPYEKSAAKTSKRRSQEARGMAAEKGLDVVAPQDNQLFLDLDGAEGIHNFLELWKMFQNLFPAARIVKQTPSKSGVGQHVIVQLASPEPATMRIAMQAVLGSDLKREMFSLRRVIDGDPEPTLFFEVPKKHRVRKASERDPEREATPWAVRCWTCAGAAPISKLVYLTRVEYTSQINNPNLTWRCPECGGAADWDSKTYEDAIDAEDPRV